MLPSPVAPIAPWRLPSPHGPAEPLCGFAEVPASLRGQGTSSDKYWHMLVIIIAVSQQLINELLQRVRGSPFALKEIVSLKYFLTTLCSLTA